MPMKLDDTNVFILFPNPAVAAKIIGLGDRITPLFSSNFMVVVSSVSVIFYTGSTYSCSSNKEDCVKL